jgi:hypothetical protein
MSELIQRYEPKLHDDDGVSYEIAAWGEETIQGTWEGWLEFYPSDNGNLILRTDRETTQPNRAAVQYWASGLEPLYFEGAFERAHPESRL